MHKKKFLSILLTFALVLGLLPWTAVAVQADAPIGYEGNGTMDRPWLVTDDNGDVAWTHSGVYQPKYDSGSPAEIGGKLTVSADVTLLMTYEALTAAGGIEIADGCTLTIIGVDNVTPMIGANISGAGSVAAQGGSFYIVGTVSATGGMTVNGGSVVTMPYGGVTVSCPITLAGGTFQAEGYINGATVTVASGCVYSDGESDYTAGAINDASALNGKTLKPYAARVGETYCTTFADALTAAAGGGTVKLLRDVSLAAAVTVTGGTEEKPIVLDLDGHFIQSKGSDRCITVGMSGVPAVFELTDSKAKSTESTDTHYYYLNDDGLAVIVDSADDEAYKNAERKGSFVGGCLTGGKTGQDGGAVTVSSGSTFAMRGGTIIGSTAGMNGGGVYVSADKTSGSGTFKMSGGEICGNTARYCGGVYVYGCGKFEMSGGKISGNESAEGCGGGVHIEADFDKDTKTPFPGVFIMSDGEICDNTAIKGNGGGVYVYGGGTFAMSGGKISGNTTGTYGGGVCVMSGLYAGEFPLFSTFKMSDGEISDNAAKDCGGGVYVDAGSTFEMRDGKISGNTADVNGGGVCASASKTNGTTLDMRGGKISGNAAGNAGGGVFVEVDDVASHLKVSGTVAITGNVASDKTPSNVCLDGGIHKAEKIPNAVIHVTDKLSEDTRIGVTLAYGYTGAFTKSESDGLFTAGNFASDVETARVVMKNGQLEMAACHSVTADADLKHGKLTFDSDSAVEGETVTLTVKPDKGYQLAKGSLSASAAPPQTIKDLLGQMSELGGMLYGDGAGEVFTYEEITKMLKDAPSDSNSSKAKCAVFGNYEAMYALNNGNWEFRSFGSSLTEEEAKSTKWLFAAAYPEENVYYYMFLAYPIELGSVVTYKEITAALEAGYAEPRITLTGTHEPDDDDFMPIIVGNIAYFTDGYSNDEEAVIGTYSAAETDKGVAWTYAGGNAPAPDSKWVCYDLSLLGGNTYSFASLESTKLTPKQSASDPGKYTFTMPNGDVTVTAKFEAAPSSSGGGDRDRDRDSSPTPVNANTGANTGANTADNASNKDVVTVTNTDGGKTESQATTTEKKNADGSVTVTDTLKKTTTTEGENGSSVEVKTDSTHAETTNSTTNKDGSVTDTTKVNSTETVTAATTGADGKRSTVETKTEQDSSTAVTTKDNADGSKAKTTETAVTLKVTETVTDANGAVTQTVTETVKETKAETTVKEDGTEEGKSTTTTTVKDEAGNVLSTAVTEAEIKATTDENGVTTTETTATTTTTDAQGNETVVKTVTTESKTPDGSTGTVVKDETGKVLSQETAISREEFEKALKENRPIHVPVAIMAKVEPKKALIKRDDGGSDGGISFIPNTQSPVPLTVKLPEGRSCDKNGDGVISQAEKPRVEIQVPYSSSGIIAMLRDQLGRLRVSRDCYPGSIIVPVSGSCELYIVDNTKTFADVKSDAWYSDYVTFVTAREIFNGTGDDTFAPGAAMTRGMLAQVLFNFELGASASSEHSFADAAGKWYADAASWAASIGVVSGTDAGFDGDAAVTREQVATMLYRYAKHQGSDVSARADLSKFADADSVSGWAKDAMAWAVSVGIVSGSTDASGSVVLDAQGNATRAQIAAIMERFCEKAAR